MTANANRALVPVILDGPQSVSASPATSFRLKRAKYVRALIDEIHAEKGACSIIDIGGTEDYWQVVGLDLMRSRNVHVTLVNLERHPPAREPDLFSVALGNGCALPYADHSFDLVHSNSVIEHVDGWDRRVAFAREIHRLARRYYVQTPNFWFPWEPHLEMPFLHWLPEPLRLWIALHCKLGTYDRAAGVGAAMRILSDASLLCPPMVRHLFPDSEIVREKFCGMTKSLICIRR